jgi:hypothetical protein
MQSNLSRPEIQEYIRQHEHADERLLVLKHREIFGVDSSLIAEQIAARRKAKEKLPEYYATSNIIYPPVLNLEQSSSQSTATFKARVMREALGVRESELIVDLTGGFGVDTLHFAKVFAKVFYVEPIHPLWLWQSITTLS